MKEDGRADFLTLFCSYQNVASDFGTRRSHESKGESGVVSKGWCVRVLCHLDSPIVTIGHDDGLWF